MKMRVKDGEDWVGRIVGGDNNDEHWQEEEEKKRSREQVSWSILPRTHGERRGE